jgi:Uma2 family endonuclease
LDVVLPLDPLAAGDAMKGPGLKARGVYYPESDGKPMAETDRHRDLMIELIAAARYYFRDARDVYVSGNLLVYFVEGDPKKCVAPDFFVVRGVAGGQRRIYKVWEEGKPPDVVIELTSRKTHSEDLRKKKGIYENLGVDEYFIFDPDGVRFEPQLQGFCLHGGSFQPLEARREPGDVLVMRSDVLGLELFGQGNSLYFVDPSTGQTVPGPDDFVAMAEEHRRLAEEHKLRVEKQRRLTEEQRRLTEEQRRRAEKAEEDALRLRQELEQLRRKSSS